MLQNPLHRSIQITWLALILSVLVPALAQVLGADPVLVWILGGTAALVCLIILPILYVTGRRYLREMQALTGGEYLVRWLLEPADWLRFTEDDWRRARKSALSTTLWTAGIGWAHRARSTSDRWGF